MDAHEQIPQQEPDDDALPRILHKLNHIQTEVERMSVALEALTARVGELETADQVLTTAVQAVVSEVGTLDHEIEELKGKSGNPEVEAALEALSTRVGTVTTSLDSAVTSLQSVEPKLAPTNTSELAKFVYRHVGSGEIDSQWTASGERVPTNAGTEDAGALLYYFAGDAEHAPSPSGVSAEWVLYEGAIESTA